MIERRAYGKVYRTYWTDPEIRKLAASRKLLLVYYYSSPYGNMIGLYHAPFALTAAYTGLNVEYVKRWTLHDLKKWVTYDTAAEEVLVHNAGRAAIESTLHAGDKRRKAIERLAASAHSEKLRRLFLDLYRDWALQVSTNHRDRSPLESPTG